VDLPVSDDDEEDEELEDAMDEEEDEQHVAELKRLSEKVLIPSLPISALCFLRTKLYIHCY
jgi:hypothetical protein